MRAYARGDGRRFDPVTAHQFSSHLGVKLCAPTRAGMAGGSNPSPPTTLRQGFGWQGAGSFAFDLHEAFRFHAAFSFWVAPIFPFRRFAPIMEKNNGGRTAMFKKLLVGLFVLILILAGGLFYLGSNLDSIVRAAIEKVGTAATQATVSLDSVKIRPSAGTASLSGL
jgi:hypothetical protein